jgi:hypothetical protein
MSFVWRSKPFYSSLLAPLAVAAIDADAWPVTLRVYVNGALKHTRTATSIDSFRLPGGYRSARVQFELSASSKVSRMRLASSVNELQSIA